MFYSRVVIKEHKKRVRTQTQVSFELSQGMILFPKNAKVMMKPAQS